MGIMQNKIDFVMLVSVTNANPNGDPLNGNRPRSDYDGVGEMSDVCIKRKIRNRLQDMGESIFVKSDDRCDDGYISLKQRADSSGLKSIKNREEFEKIACEKWIDVRAFGQVFAFSDFGCKSVGVRGPVSIHQARSISSVEIESMQITKSTSGDRKTEGERGSDTMGTKHFVRFGLYEIKGSINVQLAEKTGFTEEDTEKIKEALKTLFMNDASAARPDGSMEVEKLYWWKHDCKDGQYSSAKVHRLVKVEPKDSSKIPNSIDDYNITLGELPNLAVEIFDGL
nr:type I-C CRISPR-associated protein Cas7/Csd2 [uncultured Butyrivibrio sp.]